MEFSEYVNALAAEAALLGEAARSHPGEKVPGCPEWVAADVLSHMGRIYSWVAEIIRLAGDPFEGDRPEPPADVAERFDWYEAHLRDVLAEFESHQPGDPAWTFAPGGPQEVGWWARRQALETAIHRFDAQSAGGSADPIEARLAADGVDEFLMGFLPFLRSKGSSAELRGTLHVHATDTAGEWVVDLDADDGAPRREHAKADTALRGPASGLYLWVWNRRDADEAGLEVFGNRATVAAWREIAI